MFPHKGIIRAALLQVSFQIAYDRLILLAQMLHVEVIALNVRDLEQSTQGDESTS